MSTDAAVPRIGLAGDWPDHWIRSPEVCQRTGCTYRQLDYWTRTGLITAAYGGLGSGNPRGYELAEVLVIRRIVQLVAAGLDPRVAAAAARQGHQAWISDTVQVTVLPDRKAHA